MARAKRHYLPGHVWHITHRCHKREFLLKFPRDRRRWIQWQYQAKKRYSGLSVLNYAHYKWADSEMQTDKIICANDTFERREGQTSYGETSDLDSGNTFLWDQQPPRLIGKFLHEN